jgi:DNA-directed RNA polymerase specialized sigma24 family protein
MGYHQFGLTPEQFDALLLWLGPDRERAGELYEKLRAKLIKLLECRGALFPEEVADDTFDRVAQKLAQGADVYARDRYSFLWGVAGRVYQEWLSRNRPPALPPRELAPDPMREHLQQCLDRCLDKLPSEERQMILKYYEGEGGAKIAGRAELAVRAGVSAGALRIRACRLRQQLETCVRRCVEFRTAEETNPSSRPLQR